MKIIGISIALFFIITLPATSMALTIHGNGLTFQATADDIPADNLLSIISEMTGMHISLRGDLHDINTTGGVIFFETMPMGGFVNAPAGPGNGLPPLRNTGAKTTDAAAAMPLLVAGLLGLAFIGDRIVRKKQPYLCNR